MNFVSYRKVPGVSGEFRLFSKGFGRFLTGFRKDSSIFGGNLTVSRGILLVIGRFREFPEGF